MLIATPISNLFNDPQNAQMLIEYSDCLECRDNSINKQFGKQELFHCELQPIHSFSSEDFNYLQKIKEQKKELKLISFHLASCYKNPSINNGRFIPDGVRLSRELMLNNASKNFYEISKILGNDVNIAVENNNYYPTPAYDVVTDGEFISEIVRNNQIYFLLDISHAAITASYKGISLSNYLSELPLDEILQLHISKPDINSNNELYDAHIFPDKEFLKSNEKYFEFPRLKYVTIEYYENARKLSESISYLREIINEQKLFN